MAKNPWHGGSPLVTGPNERDEELLKKVCLYVSLDDPVKLHGDLSTTKGFLDLLA